MAQKRTGRGRPRRGNKSTGFPATRRRRRMKTPPGSEPTSAFEALCQVTSAELERLNNNPHSNSSNNSDNRSDSSSKSTEENRNVYAAPISSPSDVTLPAWYGVHVIPPKPFKTELILPPKKKKYLHYLSVADDDNQIINNPFRQPENLNNNIPWEETNPTPPVTVESTTVKVNGIKNGYYLPGAAGSSKPSEELAPLKFNPTPMAPSTARTQDGKTFSDVLDEHISRLIIQNDVIVSKQPTVVMSKRGRSRDSTSSKTPPDLSDTAEAPPRSSTGISSHPESMVKTLLSSKLTRKTMLAKEVAVGRQQHSVNSFSYLNPENSAIKDLLIKTYEEKGMISAAMVRDPSDSFNNGARQQFEFKAPGSLVNANSAVVAAKTGSSGFVFKISSDQRNGALVVPDSRDADINTAWTVSPGNEWVSIDERGRKRVHPEFTVFPETAAYQAATPNPIRSLRSPSAESMVSSESGPSSISGRRMVQTTGTFLPGQNFPERELVRTMQVVVPAGVVRTAGTFHPVSSSSVQEKRLPVDSSSSRAQVTDQDDIESHEKALNALRGHLTGKRPTEETSTSKREEVSFSSSTTTTEKSMLPPKKRKSFHLVDKSVMPVEEEPTMLQPISPVAVMEDPQQRGLSSTSGGSPEMALPAQQQVIQEPMYSGYATYVNENHTSHLSFYSDLSRQYSTNLAFAQTLLQQGHYYPSFRYSCVTTNSIRGGRPIHVPNGEHVSMYANWSPMPSIVNPNIHVDSTIYGKKKQDGSFYSCATKRSVHVSATSFETYNRKRQLIMSGRNSFLPMEAVKLTSTEPVMRRSYYEDEKMPSTSEERYYGLNSTSGGIKVEAVSDEECDDSVCSKCGKSFARSAKTTQYPFVCAHCVLAMRPRAESINKNGKKSVSHRKSPDAIRGPIDHVEKGLRTAEKQLITQRLQQRVSGHHQLTGGPSGMRLEDITHNSNAGSLALEQEESKPPLEQLEQDVMDLSVKRLSSESSAWRSHDGASNKFPCQHCGKIYTKESQLYLHSRVHEMQMQESPGKSDKKNAKNRRERSCSPTNSNQQVTATTENPRPFACAECNVGFRIHGHLQKHLRSKGHITQLECKNELPCGFYAELERQNLIAKLHTIIDTADCAKAYVCLKQLAASVMQQQGEEPSQQ